MKSRKIKKFFLPLLALSALALTVSFFALNRSVSAVQLSGAVYTTDVGCGTVNVNLFKMKSDVYLNGGPKGGSSGLNDGFYWVKVTNPGGDVLLGQTKTASVQVVNGKFVECYQLTKILYSASSGLNSLGYDDTGNNGGVYKVSVSMNPNFPSSETKTDNFKVKESSLGPQSAIGGTKYEDKNNNGAFDEGEPPLGGITIQVTLDNGPAIDPIVTDSNGNWSLVFPVGTGYTACEVLAVDSPYTQTGPNVGAQSPDSLATATLVNGKRCWRGVVGNVDTSGLNFYNIVCQPVITCPAKIENKEADANCQAVVTYTTPTSTDNCGGTASVVCTPASGSTFSLGTSTVACIATGGINSNNTASCSFTVTVVDKTAPVISPLKDIETCNTGQGTCTKVVTYTATANDNCDGAVLPDCKPASGSTFALGTTTVTCTATDSHGNKSSASFTVTVKDCSVGSVSGRKIYDANGPKDGDGGGGGVEGFKIVLSGSASATTYTDANGYYSFKNLPAGSYKVTEVPPAASTSAAWVATKPTASPSFTVSCANATNDYTNDFCNYCKVPSGGLSKGFWGNNNGKALITAADLCALTKLPLRNANGSNFDPVPDGKCGTPITLTTKEITDGKTALDTWLQAANATNMANMLSAQLAAAVLNVRQGKASGTAVTLCFNGTINSLIAAATTSLTTYPNTTAAGAARSDQENMKNCLEGINIGSLVILSPKPCSITTPY
ncbi:MAG: HYR domain-containing protein [Acidobacteria bacterium]|nr:HYR domain-containing protein [Acidobacteriota bacterium]